MMPPMMITGAINGRNASLKLTTISRRLARGSLGKPRGPAISQMAIIIASPMTTPGMAPARNRRATETVVIAP